MLGRDGVQQQHVRRADGSEERRGPGGGAVGGHRARLADGGGEQGVGGGEAYDVAAGVEWRREGGIGAQRDARQGERAAELGAGQTV